jgi:hypothetical protein
MGDGRERRPRRKHHAKPIGTDTIVFQSVALTPYSVLA